MVVRGTLRTMVDKDDAPEALLTVDEVAHWLSVDPRTVRDMGRRGELPAGKVGTQWRFDRRMVGEWMDSKLLGGNDE